MSQKHYYVYIMASRKRGAFYVGVTSDLEGRVWEHKNDVGSKHVAKYKIYNLVHAEPFSDISDAIIHEKRVKRWSRAIKIDEIEKHNPKWEDISKYF